MKLFLKRAIESRILCFKNQHIGECTGILRLQKKWARERDLDQNTVLQDIFRQTLVSKARHSQFETLKCLTTTVFKMVATRVFLFPFLCPVIPSPSDLNPVFPVQKYANPSPEFYPFRTLSSVLIIQVSLLEFKLLA